MCEPDKKTWKERLAEAIEKDGRSKTAISKATGRGPMYVSQIFSENKTPTIDNLNALCNTLNVSPVYICYGLDFPEELTPYISRFSSLDPNDRAFILQFLERFLKDMD